MDFNLRYNVLQGTLDFLNIAVQNIVMVLQGWVTLIGANVMDFNCKTFPYTYFDGVLNSYGFQQKTKTFTATKTRTINFKMLENI